MPRTPAETSNICWDESPSPGSTHVFVRCSNAYLGMMWQFLAVPKIGAQLEPQIPGTQVRIARFAE